MICYISDKIFFLPASVIFLLTDNTYAAVWHSRLYLQTHMHRWYLSSTFASPLQLRVKYVLSTIQQVWRGMQFLSSVASSPPIAHQVTQEHSLPKYPALRQFLRPLAVDYDLMLMEGPIWKRWRGIFNPGFITTHLV